MRLNEHKHCSQFETAGHAIQSSRYQSRQYRFSHLQDRSTRLWSNYVSRGTKGGTHESQDTHGECRLPAPSASQQANTLSRLQLERYVLEHGWKLRCILDDKPLNRDERVAVLASRGRPICRWTTVLDDSWWLLRKAEVLDDTLDGAREGGSKDREDEGRVKTHLRSSSSAVQKRHAQ